MKLREKITILAPDGTTIAEVTPEKGSRRVANLMQDDYIEVKFTLADAVRFPRGSWTLVANETHRTPSKRYIVADEVLPTYNTATGGYDYQMRLDAWHYSWQRYKFSLAPEYGPTQTSFDYTDNVAGHIGVLHRQLAQLAATDPTIQLPTAYALHYNGRIDIWAVADAAQVQTEGSQSVQTATFMADETVEGVPLAVITEGADGTLAKIQTIETTAVDPDTNEAAMLLTDEVRHVQYGDLNIIEAINAMCAEDAFACEWWMDDDSILHLGRCEWGEAIGWQRGRDYPALQRSRSSQEYGTRIIAFGSTQNVPSRYRKFVPFQVTNNTEVTTDTANSDDDEVTPDEGDCGGIDVGESLRHDLTIECGSVTVTVPSVSFDDTGYMTVTIDKLKDWEGAGYVKAELYFGNRMDGRLLASHEEGSEQSANTDHEISLAIPATTFTGLQGTTQKLMLYLTIIGKGAIYDVPGEWDGEVLYRPTASVFWDYVAHQVTRQTFYDSAHKVTADMFLSEYRRAFSVSGAALADGGCYTVPDNRPSGSSAVYSEGHAVIGSTSLYANLVRGRTYTVTVKGAIYFDASNTAVEQFINELNFVVATMDCRPWRMAELQSMVRQSGLYEFRKELQLVPTEDTITGSVPVTIVFNCVPGVKIYMADTERGAWLQISSTADYYDEQTGSMVHVSGAKAFTEVCKADAYGEATSDAWECSVDDSGNIVSESAEEMAVGQRFAIAGLQSSKVPVTWFTDKYGDSLLSSYTRRLMLPIDTCPKNYIDSPRIQTEGVTRTPEVVEVVKVFDDIYPTLVVDLLAVEQYTENKDYIDDDGKTATKSVHCYKFYLRKADFAYSADYIQDGGTLRCIFQSGRLAGCTFELDYGGDVRSGALYTAIGTGEVMQVYTMIVNNDFGIDLPNDVLFPVGQWNKTADGQWTDGGTADKIVFVGYNPAELTDLGLVDKAERRLETAARAYLDKISLDASTYAVPLRADVAEGLFSSGAGYPAIGRKISLMDDTYFDGERETRVIGYERPLDIPFDNPKFTLGESLRYSRLGKIEKKL